MSMLSDIGRAAPRFVEWLESQVIASARGDHEDTLEVEPSGRFWLGRLASEEAVVSLMVSTVRSVPATTMMEPLEALLVLSRVRSSPAAVPPVRDWPPARPTRKA